jgi:hypothetical protein
MRETCSAAVLPNKRIDKKIGPIKDLFGLTSLARQKAR